MTSLTGLFSLNLLRRREYKLLDSALFCVLLLSYFFFTAIAYPSYTHPPAHYSSLRRKVSEHPSHGNIRNEKVFIAASLYDPTGKLAQGAWGSSILQLITLLGEENVFVSIYENEIEDKNKTRPRSSSSQESSAARHALEQLSNHIPCNKSILYETMDLDQLPTVVIPTTGEKRVKRITYLAETRNRALRPLNSNGNSDINSDSEEMKLATRTRFHKLLFLNDVAFDPIDALQLLFSTNVDSNGIAQYRAACAVDFINPFKFYDTYATRDLDGYSMGLPFFPWFSSAGSERSRQAVLAGSDSVPVRSCWGGMVAFDAQYFQNENGLIDAAGDLPARFRALTDFDHRWDASECCLIHADIQRPPDNDGSSMELETGVYMNPFVRVAYDTVTLSWLSTTRRVEGLYSGVQRIGNYLVGLPWFNPRREYNVGGFDGFCGRMGQGIQVVVPRREGKNGWKTIP